MRSISRDEFNRSFEKSVKSPSHILSERELIKTFKTKSYTSHLEQIDKIFDTLLFYHRDLKRKGIDINHLYNILMSRIYKCLTNKNIYWNGSKWNSFSSLHLFLDSMSDLNTDHDSTF